MDKSEYFLMSVTEKQYYTQNAYNIAAHQVLWEWLNFLRTGRYGRSGGLIGGRIAGALWWSSEVGSDSDGRGLDTSPAVVNPQYSYYRGDGFAVRCVVREGWERVNSYKIRNAFGAKWCIV